jgi:hypothetical protein
MCELEIALAIKTSHGDFVLEFRDVLNGLVWNHAHDVRLAIVFKPRQIHS